MYKARVLIISDKKEQSIKYKKLIEVQNQDVVITNNLSDALSVIQKQEVEFIIISEVSQEASLLMDSLFLGLKGIERDYGKRFITVKA